MKINIFAPTYHRQEMTKRCFDSIIPSIESSVYDTNLYICDNHSSEEMIHWLSTLESDKIKIFSANKNVGKAGIINAIYEQNNDCTHVISIDSDFIHDEDFNWVDTMVWHIEHFKKFGLLSAFQKGNDQHLWKGLEQKVTHEDRSVSYGKYNSVAGGCVILKKEVWDDLGGYNTYGGVYGFDDGIMMQEVHKRNLLVGVMDSVKLTHPIDDDKEYVKWKGENIRKRKKEGYFEKS